MKTEIAVVGTALAGKASKDDLEKAESGVKTEITNIRTEIGQIETRLQANMDKAESRIILALENKPKP
jgi:hypothetical protein